MVASGFSGDDPVHVHVHSHPWAPGPFPRQRRVVP
jgi:hypothetical protein